MKGTGRRSSGIMAVAFRACAACVLVACAGTHPAGHGTTLASGGARPSVRGEEFHVVGRTAGAEGDAYDAALLFDRGTAAMRAQRCDDALAGFDRLLREFPGSGLVPAAQFNRGVCLQHLRRLPEAADAMRVAAAAPRDPDLARDALFRLAALGEDAQQPPWVLEGTAGLLARPRLEPIDRVEALARRAAALLAQGQRDEAVRAAEQAVIAAPTPDAVSALGDDTYAAQARFILGEATRTQAAEVVYRVEQPGAEDAITRRVQLVTHAHVEFNDAIRVGNPHWAAAAGFRIGEMYRDLYDAIVNAPLPADWDDHAREIYRRRTSERLHPLLQGALRSWEATLTMARRTGISDNDWVRRADQALENLRNLILGPDGASPGSAPAPHTPRTTPTVPGGTPPSPSTVRPAA